MAIILILGNFTKEECRRGRIFFIFYYIRHVLAGVWTTSSRLISHQTSLWWLLMNKGLYLCNSINGETCIIEQCIYKHIYRCVYIHFKCVYVFSFWFFVCSLAEKAKCSVKKKEEKKCILAASQPASTKASKALCCNQCKVDPVLQAELQIV